MAVTAPSVYFKMDNTLTDAVGGSITLTNNNSVAFGTGKLNQCADLEKSTPSYLSIDTAMGASAADINFSFQMWFQLESQVSGTGVSQFQNFLCYVVESAGNGWSYFIDYYVDAGVYRLRWLRGGSEVAYNMGGTPLNLATWYHLVGTYDGSNIRLYLNGSQVGSTVAASGVADVGSSPNIMRLGQYRDGNANVLSRYFDGAMDEVGFWFGHCLSSSEITELYNSGNAKAYPYSVAYSIAADLATYTLTGVANTLRTALRMTGALGTYALTGVDAALSWGRKIVADTGVFILTGFDSVLSNLKILTANVGDFALTGVNATFQTARMLTAEVGSFVLTGITTVLRKTGWSNDGKSSASWSNNSKNSSTWSNQDKSD